MPLPRAAEKTSKTDIFKVDFPIKPGETEFQVTYVLPAGSPFTFHGEVTNIKGMAAGPLRLIAPPGVTFAGRDIEQVGTEPNTQAVIYNVKAANGPFAFDISGTGSLQRAVGKTTRPRHQRSTAGHARQSSDLRASALADRLRSGRAHYRSHCSLSQFAG